MGASAFILRGGAAPWVIYNHGLGQTGEAIVTEPLQSAFFAELARAGYVIIASDYSNTSCWGNSACVSDIADLQTLWHSRLDLGGHPFVVGESMGGVVTWNAISHGTLSPRAAIGIYPACSLEAVLEVAALSPSIEAAYPDGFAGYDPLQTPPQAFVHVPMLMWASYSDGTVVRSQNEDPFAASINASGGSAKIITSTGNHGDPSNFDSAAVLAFFAKH